MIGCRDESSNEKAADEDAGKDRQEVTDVHGHDGQHAASRKHQSPSDKTTRKDVDEPREAPSAEEAT